MINRTYSKWKSRGVVVAAILTLVLLGRFHTVHADPAAAPQADAERTITVTNGAVRYAFESIDEANAYAAAHPESLAKYAAMVPGHEPGFAMSKAIANSDWALAQQIADAQNAGTFNDVDRPHIDDPEDIGDDGDDEVEPGDGHGSDVDEPPGTGPYISFVGPNTCGCEPPDPTLTVGTNHVLLAINDVIRAVSKSGVTAWSTTWETFFASVNPAGAGAFTSDPKVFFDPNSQRYFATILYINSAQTKSWTMLAVSTTDNITDSTTTWRKWAFDPTIADAGKFADYPSFGFDNDAVYITYNMFNGPTVDLLVFPKAQLLVNTPSPTFSQIVNIKNSSGGNAFTLQPCQMLGASTPSCYLINTQSSGSLLYVYQVNNPLGSPTLTKTSVSVASYSAPPGGAQSGTATTINTNDARTINAVWRNNTIYCAHETNSSSLCSAQWFQVSTSAWPSASLSMSGIYNTGPAHYCFPSVSVDIFGNMGMGFTRTSSSEFPSAWHTSRLAGDPAGTLAAPTQDHAGLRFYTGTRWGDFSGTAIDPTDGTTFWTLQEFAAAAAGSWSTWCTSFQLQSPCGTITVSPGALPNGLVGSFYSQNLSASGGNGSYTYTLNGGSLTPGLSLSSGGVVSGTPSDTGDHTFTVKVTDGLGCTGTQNYSIHTDCPTILLSPTTLPDGVYGAAYSQTLNASGGTSPYTWTLESGSLPPNMSLSGSGDVTGSPTALGTYNFGARATDSYGCSAAPLFSITIQTDCSLPGDINGDGNIDGLDISAFLDCYLTGTTGIGNCRCVDYNLSNAVDDPDVTPFVNALLP